MLVNNKNDNDVILELKFFFILFLYFFCIAVCFSSRKIYKNRAYVHYFFIKYVTN